MFYTDRPTLAKDNNYPKTVTETKNGKEVIISGPSPLQQYHGYKLRKNHVEKSQEVPYCTNLHIDFLQSAILTVNFILSAKGYFLQFKSLILYFFPSWIPPGISMRLKFIRNDDNFVIIADKEDGIYKMKLLQLYVEFRKIKVDTSVLSREMAAL